MDLSKMNEATSQSLQIFADRLVEQAFLDGHFTVKYDMNGNGTAITFRSASGRSTTRLIADQTTISPPDHWLPELASGKVEKNEKGEKVVKKGQKNDKAAKEGQKYEEDDSDDDSSLDDTVDSIATVVPAKGKKCDDVKDVEVQIQPFTFEKWNDTCPRCNVIKCGNCSLMHELNRCPATARLCNHCRARNHFECRCPKLLRENKM